MTKASKNTHETSQGWTDPRSSLSIEHEDNKLHVYGTVCHHDAEFRFSLRQQSTGGAVMRGSVSVISPIDGQIMQISGREKTAKLEELKAKRPKYLDDMSGKRLPELNLTTSVHTMSLDPADIKKAVLGAVLRLYTAYAHQIHRAFDQISRPDTITPITAAHKNVDKFMESNHRKLSSKVYTQCRNDILTMCADLPSKPMSDFTQSQIESFFKSRNLSQRKKDLLAAFWLYCLQAGICIGTSPFPVKQKRKLSPNVAARNAVRPDILSLDEQDKLYNCLDAECTGGDCGIALQIWKGFSAKTACEKTWGDLLWKEGHNDYARIKHSRPNLVGATHDFTAPIFPAGALLLRKRYLSLVEKYDEETLKKMPIVSQSSNPKKAMTAEALVAYTTMRLHSIGLSYAALQALGKSTPQKIAVSKLLLHNTFLNNVYYRCALENEEGTAKFLCGESLSSNTTDDNYTCFSDDEAGERLHNIMSVLTPEQAIDVDDSPKVLPNGRVQHTYAPETTRQRVGHVGVYKLQPGEEIIIKCPHGVKGSVTTRAYNEDGSLRRKTQKRKNDTK